MRDVIIPTAALGAFSAALPAHTYYYCTLSVMF